MLIIAGHIQINPDHVEKLMPAAVEMMAATHQEEGCQEYVFSEDPATPGRIMVFEVWDSDEALGAHFAAPHMAAFQAKMVDIDVQGRSLNKYDVASVESLG